MRQTKPEFADWLVERRPGHINKQKQHSRADKALFMAEIAYQQTDKHHCHAGIFGLITGYMFWHKAGRISQCDIDHIFLSAFCFYCIVVQEIHCQIAALCTIVRQITTHSVFMQKKMISGIERCLASNTKASPRP
jgi:hypothetical protein